MRIERVKLVFMPGFVIEFVDRGRGIKQVLKWCVEGTWHPVVVYGPEGCGKSSWLKQTVEILKGYGFDVIYVDPLRREYTAYTDVKEVITRITEVIADTTGYIPIKLADLVISLTNQLLKKWGKKRVALLVDDVFQAIGLERVETYVKGLLNIIEYPPEIYERIVVIATTSEGLSRARIGRHRWAWLMPMWNMSKDGFKELYEKLPRVKPPFEDVWRLTGGNPEILKMLYQSKWDVSTVIEAVIEFKKLRSLITSLSDVERKWLSEAVDDPDTLFTRERVGLLNKLVELNLIVDDLPSRNSPNWLDEPPPKKDLEVGIGEYIAWQTPIHREAVREVLKTPISF